MSSIIKSSRRKPSLSGQIFDVCNILVMCAVMLVTLFPVWHVLCLSLSDGIATTSGGIFLWPRQTTLASYRAVSKDAMLVRSYLNSIVYTLGNTFCVLFFSSMTAYSLSNDNFCLKRFVTIFLTITMFISGGMIPSYILIRSLGMMDTLWVMIIPGCVSAYNVILFRTFFKGIPQALKDAARIDGAGEMRIYIMIILPLSLPIFATLGLFTIVGKWNSWFEALIYLNSTSKYPLQMILRRLLFEFQLAQDETTLDLYANRKVTPQSIKMASIIVTSLPILCVYPFVQRYFVKGVFVGTIKG